MEFTSTTPRDIELARRAVRAIACASKEEVRVETLAMFLALARKEGYDAFGQEVAQKIKDDLAKVAVNAIEAPL